MIKSIISTGSFNISSQLIVFIVEIIIARILLPTDFGAFALALIAVELISFLSLKSFAVSFVQDKNSTSIDLSSIVYSSIILSLLLSVFSYNLTSVIVPLVDSNAFHGSYKILVWAAPILTIEYIYRTALLKKQLYWQVGASELVSVVIYALSLILLSINGFGLYALIYSFLIRQCAKLFIVTWLCKKEYKLISGYSFGSMKKYFRMSFAMTLQSMFLFSTANTDKYFVTLAGGTAGVGLYSRALKLIQMPLNQIVRNISSVLFVEFSKKQDDRNFLHDTFITTTSALAFLFFPITIGVYLYSELIVTIVYGQKWIAMSPILQVLVFGVVISSMSIIVGDLLKSQKVVYRELFSNMLSLLVLIGFSLILYKEHSMVGVAIAFLLSQCSFLLLQLIFLNKVLSIKPAAYFKAILKPLFFACIFYTMSKIMIALFSKETSLMITIGLASVFFLYLSYQFKQDSKTVKIKIMRLFYEKNRYF